MVAAAVVVSSVAVMSPYETKGSLQLLDQAAEASFTSQANKECATTLPKYRPVLAAGVDGPSILAAALQVDFLRQRLAAIPAYRGIEGPVEEWLQAWTTYTADQRRYADIIGRANTWMAAWCPGPCRNQPNWRPMSTANKPSTKRRRPTGTALTWP